MSTVFHAAAVAVALRLLLRLFGGTGVKHWTLSQFAQKPLGHLVLKPLQDMGYFIDAAFKISLKRGYFCHVALQSQQNMGFPLICTEATAVHGNGFSYCTFFKPVGKHGALKSQQASPLSSLPDDLSANQPPSNQILEFHFDFDLGEGVKRAPFRFASPFSCEFVCQPTNKRFQLHFGFDINFDCPLGTFWFASICDTQQTNDGQRRYRHSQQQPASSPATGNIDTSSSSSSSSSS